MKKENEYKNFGGQVKTCNCRMNKKEVLEVMKESMDEAGNVATDGEANNLYLQAIAEGIKYLVEKTL